MKTPVLWTWLSLLAGALPALVDPAAVRRAASLNELAESGQPFFVGDHALLLYAWAPLVAISACVLFLMPGLLAVLALGEPPTINHWILRGLAASLVLVSVATGVAQFPFGLSLRGAAFGWFVAGLSAVPALLSLGRPHASMPPWCSGRGRTRLVETLALVGVPLLLAAGLAPKFYWEAFNGDGGHAFEASRLLLQQPVPFFAPAAGLEFPGVTSMLFAFPGAWFMRLFGEIEAAARLPLVLYLSVLFGVLSELAVAGRDARARTGLGLMWLSLVAYTLAMAFSATYSAYSADIALPATQDTLFMICFLGALLAFIEQTPIWMLTFMALTYLSLPSAMLLFGMWIVAVWLVWPQRPVARLALWAAFMMLCVAAGVVFAVALRALGLPEPGKEYGAVGILRYFAFLQFTDLRRIAWVALPGGLLPALSLLLWRRQDAIARALTLITAGYFLFFFVQANVSLHHFVPSMLLPVPVLWRVMPLATGERRPWLAAAAVVTGLAVLLCLPTRAVVETTARTVGSAIEDRLGGYAVSRPGQMAGAMLLEHLFPNGFDPRVPDSAYGESPLAWTYYARHIEPPDASGPDLPYILQRADAATPAGATLLAQEDTVALYVRDARTWREHLALRPATHPGSPWLYVPRSTLFRSVRPTGGPRVYNVVSILHGIGVDTDAILMRLGVPPPS